MRARLSRALRRAKQIWFELDYAQRRLLEIQTGIGGLTPRASRRQALIDELESLYAYQPPRQAD